MRLYWQYATWNLSMIYGDIVSFVAIVVSFFSWFHLDHIHPEWACIGIGWYGILLFERLYRGKKHLYGARNGK